MRATAPSRFFVLDAHKFAQLMSDWFPMALHLLEGLFFGSQSTQAAVGQRERLLALGSISAGLTHELNNPASAAVRATSALRDRVAGMRHKLALIAGGQYDRATLETLIKLQEDAVNKHHGDLRVESIPGNTRFQIRLPFVAPGRLDEPSPQEDGS